MIIMVVTLEVVYIEDRRCYCGFLAKFIDLWKPIVVMLTDMRNNLSVNCNRKALCVHSEYLLLVDRFRLFNDHETRKQYFSDISLNYFTTATLYLSHTFFLIEYIHTQAQIAFKSFSFLSSFFLLSKSTKIRRK